MPYDSLIDRSDVGALIPEDVSRTIIQGLPAASVALTSFRRATMSRAQQRLPVLSVLPVAYWVDGDTGLKQTTEQHWANQYLDARELAVIVPIPQAVLDDVDFDIWGEVRPRLVEAFGVKIDAAAIFGTDKPAGWPDSIVEAAVAAGNVVEVGDSHGDIAADVNLVMGKVEEDGFDVTGFWARRAMKAAFRGLRDDNGQPIFQPSLTAGTPGTLYGESILYPTNGAWDATAAELIAGDAQRGHPGGPSGHQLQDPHRGRHQRRHGQGHPQPGPAGRGGHARRHAGGLRGRQPHQPPGPDRGHALPLRGPGPGGAVT